MTRPINLAQLKSGFTGRPYKELIKYHIRRQDSQQLAAGIVGTRQLFPQQILDRPELFDSFFDSWNARAYTPAFWAQDCGNVFTEIIEEARRLLSLSNLPTDDETLFNVFQMVTLNFAYAASLQPKMRKFIGIKKGLFS